MTFGYGDDPFGLGPYGSINTDPPSVIGAISLDGFTIELFFSEEMKVDANFLDPASYTLTSILGATSTINSVEAGRLGPNDIPYTAILNHTGTTLGGHYTVEVVGPIVDLQDDPLVVTLVSLFTKGEAATFTVLPQSGGEELIVQFSEDMVPTSTATGIELTDSYQITTTYPINLTIDSASHPVSGDFSQVSLDVTSMTSATYDVVIEPATVITYDGTYLPNLGGLFQGVETGTGTTGIGSGAILINKNYSGTYGWLFEDTSGDFTDTSTLRVDFEFDTTSSTVSGSTPPVGLKKIIEFKFWDGVTNIDVSLAEDNGTKVVYTESGSFTSQTEYDWSSVNSTISIVRNQLAGLISVILDEIPITSETIATYDGVSSSIFSGPGVGVVLQDTFNVSSFGLSDILLTSSETLFTNSWNFSHNTTGSFVGIPGPSRDTFPVEHGPLVKGWGDATPAGSEDVAVYLNNIRVPVSEVNPYTAEITVTTPIPLSPAGTNTVEVDYKWFSNPIFELAGLNTPGLILNKWDRHAIEHLPFNSGTGEGATSGGRFPYSVVLGPYDREQPVSIAHRFIAYETKYTSSLNSPNTLLLNVDPHQAGFPPLSFGPESVTVSYEGTDSPTNTESPWSLIGNDFGFLEEESTYRVVDESEGSLGEGVSAFYSREENLTFPSLITYSLRFQALSYTSDGVFTGIGYGVHDGSRLYLVGLLDINGVKHLGILTNTGLINEENSWVKGPSIRIEVTSTTTFKVSSSTWPTLIDIGTRFQVFDSNQSGVYTINSVSTLDPDTFEVTIESPGFPLSPNKFGSRDIDIILEVPWDEVLSTHTLRIDPDQGFMTLRFSGSLAVNVFELDRTTNYALPPQSNLLLDPDSPGEIFWGSLSREAVNDSRWTFVRYGIEPDQTIFNTRGLIVSSEMTEVPEEDPNSPWDLIQNIGFSEVDSTSTNILLKNTASSDTRDFTFSYRRVENTLRPDIFSDTDISFKVDYGSLSYGNASVIVNDTLRRIELSALLYTEISGSRELLELPNISLSGFLSPSEENWSESTTFLINSEVDQNKLILTQGTGQSGFYEQNLEELSSGEEGVRLFETTFKVNSYTFNSNKDLGFIFGGDAGVSPNKRTVSLSLMTAPNRIALNDSDTPGSPIATFSFNWDDSSFHTYRIEANPNSNTVELFVDDTSLGTAVFGTFGVSTTTERVFFGSSLLDTSFEVEIDYISAIVGAPSTSKRTLGVWKGGDKSEINNWKIPRTDTLEVDNSSLSAVVEEMDWTSTIEARIHRDVAWGVSIYRPDLASPPSATSTYATDITNPSEAWINVEYPLLPLDPNLFGYFEFGSIYGSNVVQQRWDYVRYRVYSTKEEDYISPQGMVLNRSNVVTSGEALNDKTIETLVIVSETSTFVSLKAGNIYADRIFSIYENDNLIPREEWSFNQEDQSITFINSLSGDQVPITIHFAPSKDIVTKTYLESQPVRDSQTLLNEGTPYFYSDLDTESERLESFGSTLNNPNNSDFILNDPFKFIEFEPTDTSYFDSLDIFTLEDGGSRNFISSICESTGSGSGSSTGFASIELEGLAYEDNGPLPKTLGSGEIGYGCFVLSGDSTEGSLFGPDTDAQDVLCGGQVLSSDPNAKPTNIPVTVILRDGGSTTVYYLY